MNDYYCFDLLVPLIDAPINVWFTWMLSDQQMNEFNKEMFLDNESIVDGNMNQDRCSYCSLTTNQDGSPVGIDIVLDEINWVTWSHEAFHAVIYIASADSNYPMLGRDTQEWGARILTYILEKIDNEFNEFKNKK